MAIRAVIGVGLGVVLCVGSAACSEATDADLDPTAAPSDDASTHVVVAGASVPYELSALGIARTCSRGRNCPPGHVAGSGCGSCGGTYDEKGACSISTPPNLGLPCDLGSGKGACANGGIVSCSAVCQPTDPTIGDATEWHIVPAPNGSWDWDCDGSITMTLVPTQAPPECSTYADSQNCNDAPTVEYVTESSPCGEQATLFKRDCDWKSLGPTCLDAPDGHRVVFQQCR